MRKMEMYCGQVAKTADGENCSVYRFENETGKGSITMYDVFPGVAISYNDFHMQYFQSQFKPAEALFCIDHCREGRLEYAAGNDRYSYVEAGDLKLDRRLTHTGLFEMPLFHYHGATVSFDLDIAADKLPGEIRDFPVDIKGICDKLCRGVYPTVIHEPDYIEHIFGELYTVPEKIKRLYFKVKIMELILYLEALELPAEAGQKPYYYKAQVEKVKAIQRFLSQNIGESFTQEELSERFDFPLTSMKRCFKSVVGTTIGGWVVQCRMNRAAVLLRKKKSMSVTEIAGLVGYDSPSKFAMAFRRTMGSSPLEYRNQLSDQDGVDLTERK